MEAKLYKTINKISSNFLINTDGDGPLFVLEKINVLTQATLLTDGGVASKTWSTDTKELHPAFFEFIKLMKQASPEYKALRVSEEGEIQMRLNDRSAFNDVAASICYVSVSLMRDLKSRVH